MKKNHEEQQEVIDGVTDQRSAADPTSGSVCLTETLFLSDLRFRSPPILRSIQAEIEGLHRRGVLQVVNRSEFTRGAKVMGGRMVFAVKAEKCSNPYPKCILSCKGLRRKRKGYL